MQLKITLKSDTAFGRGDGIAGLVDTEVEHDARTGFPIIKGRTIKGLLVESCADILYALQADDENPALDEYMIAAQKLFGVPGSTLADMGCLHVGTAQLPKDFRQFVGAKDRYDPAAILGAMTTTRHQTAVDPTTGKPLDGSLRTTRVVIRGTFFYTPLQSSRHLNPIDYQLLAACAAGVKRGGQNRSRGQGWLEVKLIEIDGDPLADFVQKIGSER